MQPAIKLKEIIYEVCSTCHNNCVYCGSKDVTCEPLPSNEHIYSIIDNICSYPPEEINISGGDPLLLSEEVHQTITSKLKAVGCKVKLIFNPKSFKSTSIKIEYYDWIGLSINTKEELERTKDVWSSINRDGNVTIISNFNCTNIWNYSKIEKFVKDNNLLWQIQYTMYRGENENAIYQNEDAKRLLFEKITKSLENGVQVVIADNMNRGKCSAGSQSCGILVDGRVVPCLSMRSWENEYIKGLGFGNLTNESFEKIWVQNFCHFRCESFTCCKDVINAPYIPSEIASELPYLPSNPSSGWKGGKSLDVYVYGVVNKPYIVPSYDRSDIAMVYGIRTDNVIAYAVSDNLNFLKDLVPKEKK